MLRISYSLVLMVVSAPLILGQARTPQFKDFPPKGEYVGKNAPVIITRSDRTFRTRLREAAQESPNFAGHYIFTSWGCGAACLMGAVIDANSGKVYWFPHTICCWKPSVDDNFTPIVFRLNSRLVVLTGLRDEKEGDEGAHFYEFDGKRFKFIRTLKSN